VTSRWKFDVEGAFFCRDLYALPLPEACELLLALAPRIGDLAEELAKQCGRLPLALQLAGGALRVRANLNPASYLAQLKEKGALLKQLGKHRDQAGLPLDVEASLDLSYGLLDDDAKLFWRSLSVFPADFDDAAAAAVWEIDEQAANDWLGDLEAASLIEYDTIQRRYRLHDLASEFAASKLTPDERDNASLHHARHFVGVLSGADKLYMNGRENVLKGLTLFDLERTNINAGQAWAAAHLETGDKAAQLCSDYPDAGAYCLEFCQHPRNERIPWLEAALAAAQKLRKRDAEGRHLGNLGITYKDIGEPGKAIDFYQKQLKMVHEIGDRHGEGNALGNLGNVYYLLGEMRKAIEYHEQSLQIAHEIGDRRGEGTVLSNLGSAYKDMGEPRKAIEYHEQALEISRELGDRRSEGNTLGNLGNAYADLSDPRRAIDNYEQALILSREIGDRHGEGNSLGNLGLAYADLGEIRKAIEFYEQSLVIKREIGDRRNEGNTLGNLGLAYSVLGEPRKAVEFYEQQLDITREIGDRRGEGNALGNLGNVYFTFNETRKAIEYYEQQSAIACEIGERRGEGNALWNTALAYENLGELTKAIPLARDALAIFEQIEDPNAPKVREWLAAQETEPKAR
jgi:tetratricopeptide (TPR) repeat protein